LTDVETSGFKIPEELNESRATQAFDQEINDLARKRTGDISARPPTAGEYRTETSIDE
jgi:hypothetical protein